MLDLRRSPRVAVGVPSAASPASGREQSSPRPARRQREQGNCSSQRVLRRRHWAQAAKGRGGTASGIMEGRGGTASGIMEGRGGTASGIMLAGGEGEPPREMISHLTETEDLRVVKYFFLFMARSSRLPVNSSYALRGALHAPSPAYRSVDGLHTRIVYRPSCSPMIHLSMKIKPKSVSFGDPDGKEPTGVCLYYSYYPDAPRLLSLT